MYVGYWYRNRAECSTLYIIACSLVWWWNILPWEYLCEMDTSFNHSFRPTTVSNHASSIVIDDRSTIHCVCRISEWFENSGWDIGICLIDAASYSTIWITFGDDVAVSRYVFFGWETALCWFSDVIHWRAYFITCWINFAVVLKILRNAENGCVCISISRQMSGNWCARVTRNRELNTHGLR